MSTDPHEMLRHVSRTFTLSAERLPSGIRDSLTLAYLLFRVSDCLEDNETMPKERKVELLLLWASVLRGESPCSKLLEGIDDLDDSDPEVYVAKHADAVLEALTHLPEPVQQLIIGRAKKTAEGMARWQQHTPRIENEAEMDDYMYQVAGRVGLLCTEVVVWYLPALAPRKDTMMHAARHCGLALQTVNILRGLRKDYERGWIFVPQSYLARAGLSEQELFNPGHTEAALQVIEALATKAEYHLRYGITYVQAMPRAQHRLRLAAMWPFLFAARTLAISRGNPQVLHAEAKMTRDEVKQIVRSSTLFGWSNRWYEHTFNRLLT